MSCSSFRSSDRFFNVHFSYFSSYKYKNLLTIREINELAITKRKKRDYKKGV